MGFSFMRTPHYDEQFSLSLRKAPSLFYKVNPFNTDTPLIWKLIGLKKVSI